MKQDLVAMNSFSSLYQSQLYSIIIGDLPNPIQLTLMAVAHRHTGALSTEGEEREREREREREGRGKREKEGKIIVHKNKLASVCF